MVNYTYQSFFFEAKLTYLYYAYNFLGKTQMLFLLILLLIK